MDIFRYLYAPDMAGGEVTINDVKYSKKTRPLIVIRHIFKYGNLNMEVKNTVY